MKMLLFVFPLIIFTSCNGQTKTKPANSSAVNNSKGATITAMKAREEFTFPLIQLSDKVKADRINSFLINSALGEEFTLGNFKSQFIQQSKLSRGLTSVSYKVIVNSPTVLSISIASCWTGAHDNCGDGQYNFDLTTGYNFTLDQVLIPSKKQEIQKLVWADFKKRMVATRSKAIKEIKYWYEKDMLDESYEDKWRKEYKKEYWDIDLGTNFKLTNNGLAFYYFVMPYAMVDQNYAPDSEYFYSWSVLKPFLMPSSPISPIIQ